MELRQIYYVLEIARQKSFRGAANELYITQPALTRQVKAVEDELQVRLFDRDTHGVSLTKDGEKFCERGEEVVRAMDALLESFHQPTAGSRVVINLGVFLFVRQAGILPVINEFFSKNHNVVGNLKIVDNREGEDMLRNRRLDFAILKVADDGMTFSDLEYEKLFSEQLYVLMSRSNKFAGNKAIRPEELGELRILTGGLESHYYTEIKKFFNSSGADFHVAFMNDNEWGTMIDMVRDDVGVLIASDRVCRHFSGDEITFVPLEPKKVLTTYLVSSKAPEPGIKRAFRRHVIDALKE